MMNVENQFVDGLVRKTFALGLAAAAIAAVTMTWAMAGAIVLGAFISAFNLRAAGWIAQKMADSAKRGNTGTTRWVMVLVFKMILLFVLTFVAIVLVGANPIGYVIGYSVFLPAIGWEFAGYVDRLEEDEQNAEEDDQQADGTTETQTEVPLRDDGTTETKTSDGDDTESL